MDFEGAGIAAARVVMLSKSDGRERGIRCVSDIETGRQPFVKDRKAGTKRIYYGPIFARREFAVRYWALLRQVQTSILAPKLDVTAKPTNPLIYLSCLHVHVSSETPAKRNSTHTVADATLPSLFRECVISTMAPETGLD